MVLVMLMLMFVVNLCQKADQAHQEDRCWSQLMLVDRTMVSVGASSLQG